MQRPTLGLAAALLFVATACGGDRTARDVTTQGTTATTAAPATTALATVSPQTSAVADDAPDVRTADALDLLERSFEASNGRSVRGHMSMDAMSMAGLGGALLSFEVDRDADVRTTLSLDGMIEGMTDADAEGFGVELRIVADNAYVTYTIPAALRRLLGDELPEGWFTVDAASADALGELCVAPISGGLLQRGLCEPPNDNTFLLEYVITAEIVGTEDLDGVPTTAVAFTVDYADMTETLMDEADAVLGDDLSDEDVFDEDDLFGSDDGEFLELAMTAWIDGDDLLRRMSIDFGSLLGAFAEAPADDADDFAADMGDFAQVIDFYDYDADISIEAPPADQIVGDLSDLDAESPLGFLGG